MNPSTPFSSPSRERLLALIDRLNNEGSLSGPENRELESLLSSSEEARKIFVLRQELDALLAADKSIRLRLAADLFPANAERMSKPGPSASLPAVSPVRRGLRRSKTEETRRLLPLLAASVAGFLGLIFIYQRSEELAKAFLNLQQPASQGEISYQADILPIFANHCLECHGPDDSKRKAGLRLDLPHPTAPGKEPVMVSGAPEKSPLMARIRSTDPDYQMPPPDSGKERLTPRQVELLAAWIRQGARHDLGGRSKRAALRAGLPAPRLARAPGEGTAPPFAGF